MSARRLVGRRIARGRAEGEVLLSPAPISFFGGVDPETGVVTEPGHPLEGRSVAGKVLVFPTGKGSTVGSYTLYRLARRGLAPTAIVNRSCEAIVAVGAILAGIPCLDGIELEALAGAARVAVEADAPQAALTILEG